VQNIHGGTHYLRVLLDLFDGDLRLAVAAYNAGEGAVMKYERRVPPYAETRGYVRLVLERYRELGG
jgi:soluble lytic murein transglycosylase-like protein